MRADRLLSMLLLLRMRGKMTAEELARELEVSVRTIYRDLDALSTAGAPVYTDRGPGGGCRLLDDYHTQLNGLAEDEVRALLAASASSALVELGFGAELKAARLKLLAALPSERQAEDQWVRQRILLDWESDDEGSQQRAGADAPTSISLRTIQQALWQDRRLTVTYRRESSFYRHLFTRTVDPYALVSWSGYWRLVCAADGRLRVFSLHELLAVEETGEGVERAPDLDRTAFGQLWRQPMMPTPPPFLGSNNWAVSGAKTASGNPILCNDPHLDLSLPSIWFEIQIHTPEVNAYGVSLPGLPGIIIGFNKDIAWGVTNVGHDVLDWYAIKWLDEQKSRYLLDDQPQKVTEVIEEIRVAGRKTPVLDTVKYTVWGPVVYDEPSSPYYDLAMRWLAHDKPTGNSFHQVGTFLRLMKARNYDDYSEALKGFDTPAQNFVFASREGDIALKVNGKLPVRQPGQGRFVQDGSFSGNQWRAFIPRDQIPQVRNPERGFVSSANQHSTSPAYPYYYLGDFDDYRGRVLNRLLEGMNGIEAKDMMALQFNSYSIMAEESMPVFLGLLEGASLDAAENEGLQLLKAWDFNYRKTDKAPLLHRALLDSAYALTFDEFFDRPDSLAMMTPELWRFIDLLANHPGHAIFDAKQTPEKENAAAIVQKAYKAAVKAWYADLKSGKTDWGKFNGADISHLLRLPAFSRLDLYTDGHNNSLNAIRQGHGPSWRMIVELGDPVKAYGVYPGGQSGNPGSPFYDNMVTQWAEGKYNVLNFMSSPSEKLPKMLSTWKFKS